MSISCVHHIRTSGLKSIKIQRCRCIHMKKKAFQSKADCLIEIHSDQVWTGLRGPWLGPNMGRVAGARTVPSQDWTGICVVLWSTLPLVDRQTDRQARLKILSSRTPLQVVIIYVLSGLSFPYVSCLWFPLMSWEMFSFWSIWRIA